MALSNYRRADSIRCEFHRALYEVRYYLEWFTPAHAVKDLNRARTLLTEARSMARRIRDKRLRGYMLDDLAHDEKKLKIVEKSVDNIEII